MTAANATPDTDDRRIALRRQPAMGTICRLDSADSGPSQLALVWNISMTGISLLLSEPRERGVTLAGLLETTDDEHMLPVAMRVVHTKKLETGDFYIGAQFARPLTAEELKPFVA